MSTLFYFRGIVFYWKMCVHGSKRYSKDEPKNNGYSVLVFGVFARHIYHKCRITFVDMSFIMLFHRLGSEGKGMTV